MKLKHIIVAACLVAISGAASAYPYESEFKARGAYAHDDRGRSWHDGYDRDGYDRGYRRAWRGNGYGDGYGYAGHERHCWYEHRHHRDYRVCR